MADDKKVEVKKVEEPEIEIYNQGDTPHKTSRGMLVPNGSISLPESEAKKMQSYSYIVTSDKLFKRGGVGDAALKQENADLKVQIAMLQEKLGPLEGIKAEFLGIQRLADLKALQEKYAEAA